MDGCAAVCCKLGEDLRFEAFGVEKPFSAFVTIQQGCYETSKCSFKLRLVEAVWFDVTMYDTCVQWWDTWLVGGQLIRWSLARLLSQLAPYTAPSSSIFNCISLSPPTHPRVPVDENIWDCQYSTHCSVMVQWWWAVNVRVAIYCPRRMPLPWEIPHLSLEIYHNMRPPLANIYFWCSENFLLLVKISRGGVKSIFIFLGRKSLK